LSDIFNVFLQILDDGRATDGQGRTVDFTNTLIIMTSNIGSQLILEEMDQARRDQGVLEMVRRYFKPEFLNRIDEIVTFSHLEKPQLMKIIEQYCSALNRMLADRGLQIELSRPVLELLCEKGYDRDYGARPMKRVFQREIQNPLAVEILTGKYALGSIIIVEALDEGFKFRKK
jgi:ATP-dependent Clp protease ATP-binding subunit ClpB